MNIYVANLNFGVRDADLQELFAPFGEITSARVIMDKMTGRSRGFGFVDMPDDEQGQAAIDNLNGKDFGGKALNVSVARPREERPAFNKNRFGNGGGGQGGYKKRY